jgi:hypothetical protein
MANYTDYTFGNMARLGLDECNLTQDTIQNISACNYMTQNYFASDCSMQRPRELATTQPGIMYKGGHSVGAGGCNIDDSSRLTIGTIQTHPKSRIDLFHRPFATIPYLGRGSANPVMESQIMQGEQITNKRTINNLSEKSYIKYHQTPLLPAFAKNINNPEHLVEEVASQGWVRGGLPSRELTRDTEYYR